AALAFRAAARLAPDDADAGQNVVETLGRWAERDGALFDPPCAARGPNDGAPLSIVVCSIHPDRLARMQASFRDARSLSEGYNRGLAAASHPVVVFSHDDVELLSPHPFEALDAALADHDIVGVAGSTLLNGPTWAWAGHPHLFGTVAYPHPDAATPWKATVYSLATGVIGGMQALDG